MAPLPPKQTKLSSAGRQSQVWTDYTPFQLYINQVTDESIGIFSRDHNWSKLLHSKIALIFDILSCQYHSIVSIMSDAYDGNVGVKWWLQHRQYWLPVIYVYIGWNTNNGSYCILKFEKLIAITLHFGILIGLICLTNLLSTHSYATSAICLIFMLFWFNNWAFSFEFPIPWLHLHPVDLCITYYTVLLQSLLTNIGTSTPIPALVPINQYQHTIMPILVPTSQHKYQLASIPTVLNTMCQYQHYWSCWYWYVLQGGYRYQASPLPNLLCYLIDVMVKWSK